MTAIPPSGSSPKEPTSAPQASKQREDLKYAYLKSSPFIKMFTDRGQEPSGREMKAIIDSILNSIIDQFKKEDARMKKAMEKLKRQLQGQDD